MTPSRNDGELVPFEAAHLPIVRPWFDDTEVQRWLGGPDWPEMILRLLTAFQPGEEFRGQVVLLQRAFVLLDSNEIPVALVTGDRYDRRTDYAGEGTDGPVFIDEPGPHRRSIGMAVVVDPNRRREGWGARAVSTFMTHPDLAAAEYVLAGIELENIASRRLFEQLGVSSKSEIPDWEGMLEYSKTVSKHRAERASVTTD